VTYAKDVQSELDRGNILLNHVFRPEHEIYRNPDTPVVLTSQDLKPDAFIQKAERAIEEELGKIHAFADGFDLYMRRENYAQASFMLHQVLELGYRLAEKIIIGQAKLSHSIRNHQLFIHPHAPQIGKLFESEEEVLILFKLDQAYKDARYDLGYHLSKQELEVAHAKSQVLLQHIQQQRQLLSEELLQHCPSPSHTVPHTCTVPLAAPDPRSDKTIVSTKASDRDLILSAIHQTMDCGHIYCFGYWSTVRQLYNSITLREEQLQQRHYYLVVTTEGEVDDFLQQQHIINSNLPTALRITLICIRMEDFQKNIAKGDTFYCQIAHSSERWQENGVSSIHFSTDIPIRPLQPSDMLKHWEYRHQNAINLMRAWENGLYTGGESAGCYVYALALEQICLGMIQIFLGYTPKSGNLNHLLELCHCITPLPREIFCLDSKTEAQVFRALVEAQHQFRFNINYSADSCDLLLLADRINAFIEKAGAMVTSRLAEIQVPDMEYQGQ